MGPHVGGGVGPGGPCTVSSHVQGAGLMGNGHMGPPPLWTE